MQRMQQEVYTDQKKGTVHQHAEHDIVLILDG